MSSIWGIKAQFTDKRNRRTKLFHDELSADCRLTDPNRQFQVDVFYKLLDVATNQMRSRFQGQQQVSSLFTFLFSGTMLRLTDIELETQAKNFERTYAPDLGEDLVSKARSFRREFRMELQN